MSKRKFFSSPHCRLSRPCREVALLRCYTAYVCTCAPTFRDYISVPCKQSKKNECLSLEREGTTTHRKPGTPPPETRRQIPEDPEPSSLNYPGKNEFGNSVAALSAFATAVFILFILIFKLFYLSRWRAGVQGPMGWHQFAQCRQPHNTIAYDEPDFRKLFQQHVV